MPQTVNSGSQRLKFPEITTIFRAGAVRFAVPTKSIQVETS